MAAVRIVVDVIEAEQKNAEGGRTITVSGRTSTKDVGYCALTFATAADVPVRRWNPWTAVMAVVLTTGVYALERLLGVDPLAALVDAAVAGFISFVVLEYWKG